MTSRIAAEEAPAVGVDVGATLAKLAILHGTSAPADGASFALLPAEDLEAVAERVRALTPRSIGLTGGGASELAGRLELGVAQVNEFAAWGAGASRLLGRGNGSAGERYLLVSVGTGTSALAVDGLSVTRIGGTALGGGTLLGLGAALLGTRDFDELCRLAASGSRRRVDLLVSDIYRAGEIPLMGDLTAASFGKLARAQAEPARREDLAAAIMGLVGENVALICAGLATAAQAPRIVFGGTTLRDNPSLCDVLTGITAMLGRECTLLEDGACAGALGALILARDRLAGAPG